LAYDSEEVQLIIDLQEELKVMRRLRDLQNAQIQDLQNQQQEKKEAVQQQQQEEEIINEPSSSSSKNDSDVVVDFPNLDYWKRKYRILQKRYSQLENDRALGEWMLRNRITEDSLKYHRRLIHYKKNKQTTELQLQSSRLMIQSAQTTHQKQTQQLRKQLQASAALVLQHTLRDLSCSQKRVKELEQKLVAEQQQQTTSSTTTRTGAAKSSRRLLPIIQYYKDKNMT
jgi:hypothetical protein